MQPSCLLVAIIFSEMLTFDLSLFFPRGSKPDVIIVVLCPFGVNAQASQAVPGEW